MTPEELHRTIEFIVASQARLAVAQEQDRHGRVEFQEWSKGLTAQVVRMLDIQSRRLDRQDKFYRDSLKQTEEFQSQVIGLQREALRLLKAIVNKLSPGPTPNGA